MAKTGSYADLMKLLKGLQEVEKAAHVTDEVDDSGHDVPLGEHAQDNADRVEESLGDRAVSDGLDAHDEDVQDLSNAPEEDTSPDDGSVKEDEEESKIVGATAKKTADFISAGNSIVSILTQLLEKSSETEEGNKVEEESTEAEEVPAEESSEKSEVEDDIDKDKDEDKEAKTEDEIDKAIKEVQAELKITDDDIKSAFEALRSGEDTEEAGYKVAQLSAASLLLEKKLGIDHEELEKEAQKIEERAQSITLLEMTAKKAAEEATLRCDVWESYMVAKGKKAGLPMMDPAMMDPAMMDPAMMDPMLGAPPIPDVPVEEGAVVDAEEIAAILQALLEGKPPETPEEEELYNLLVSLGLIEESAPEVLPEVAPELTTLESLPEELKGASRKQALAKIADMKVSELLKLAKKCKGKKEKK